MMSTLKRKRIPFYGEIKCQEREKRSGRACVNGAYYQTLGGKFSCGVHSRLDTKRKKLHRDPEASAKKQRMLEQRENEVETMAAINRINKRPGGVILAKLRMMRPAPHNIGFEKVFPNRLHQNRKDGHGCSALSPMCLGPVPHGMKQLPVATSIENYHQGAKIFSNEVTSSSSLFTSEDLEGPPIQTLDDTVRVTSPCKLIPGYTVQVSYRVKPESQRLRKKMYADPVPYRHKYAYPAMRKLGQDGNLNVPLFSLYYSVDGSKKARAFSYLESRYFYCHWYQRLAKATPEYAELCKRITEGRNLQITGYDAYPVELEEGEVMDLALYRCYLDTSRPFGHELVLYSLLVLPNPQDYPWNRFRRENQEVYHGFI